MPGQQVFLGQLQKEDLPEIYKHINGVEIATLSGGFAAPVSLESQTQWYEQNHKNPARVDFGIFLNETEQLMGTVSLKSINHHQQTAGLGIVIFRQEHLGKGHGTEASRLMVEYGMFHLNLYNIDLLVLSNNVRAIRAYEKAGFQTLGKRTGCFVLGGQRLDGTWMDIVRDEVDLSHLRTRYFGTRAQRGTP